MLTPNKIDLLLFWEEILRNSTIPYLMIAFLFSQNW